MHRISGAAKAVKVVATAALSIPILFAQSGTQPETIDRNAIYRIKAEASSSTIAEILDNLADRYGPRLTNSPQFRLSANWIMQQLEAWHFDNVHQEKWATPANLPIPSWQCTFFSASMVEPAYQPLIGMPEAWSPATKGSITGDVVHWQLPRTMEEFESLRGKMAGKIVLLGGPASPLPLPIAPAGRRYTREELAALTLEAVAVLNPFPPRPAPPSFADINEAKIDEWLSHERPLALLRSGAGNFAGSAAASYQGGTALGPGFQNASALPDPRPTAIVAAEHYNRMARLVERNVPVRVQLEIRTESDKTGERESFNLIGEIRGGSKAEEVVMVGAHLDSWPYATGAIDNAVGCAVAMEAMRILRRANLPMDRTVRLALWGGEEQGLLGSRAYVKQHFADRVGMQVTPEHERLSVYFNLDGGSGKIQGIYLQHNEMARPVFAGWFTGLKDLTSGAVSIRDFPEAGRRSDHMAFDEVGLPGFPFLQDPLDFETRFHTNMDTYERVQPVDAQQMAVVVASFLYQAATRAERLPRKPLPAPRRPGPGQ